MSRAQTNDDNRRAETRRGLLRKTATVGATALVGGSALAGSASADPDQMVPTDRNGATVTLDDRLPHADWDVQRYTDPGLAKQTLWRVYAENIGAMGTGYISVNLYRDGKQIKEEVGDANEYFVQTATLGRWQTLQGGADHVYIGLFGPFEED